jgi:hypothetical protein
MNVFCEGVAPASFMSTTGWVFMGFSMFNISGNVVCLIIDQLYENVLKVRKARAEKEMMSLIKVRLENLKTINKYNPKRISYI